MRWIIQGGIFMVPLMVCSVLMVAIVLERFWFFAKIMKTPLLGLLGTVTGLMRCFMLLGRQVSFYTVRGCGLTRVSLNVRPRGQANN
jgi:biopolymer transport protein ExbB/TolQ